MYPDWPESAFDLVPLPHCDGPKLEPFDFQGPQKIEFLEYIGEGAHAHVFKFRFVYDDDWPSPVNKWDSDDRDAFASLANYAEPFNSECRAYGRLREADCEHLANRCFGYLLLEDANERAMMNQFKDHRIKFNGNILFPEGMDMRGRFLGKDGRPPPIRGIVKEFGQPEKELSMRTLRSILKEVIQMQQLGIIRLDVADRQFINGKMADFSTAITFPHFITSPELNPHLTPEMVSAMELETLLFSRKDYEEFDQMVGMWNDENPSHQRFFFSLPGGDDGLKYNLRSLPSRNRLYSLVDPRLYDRKSSGGKLDGRVTKRRRRPCAKPPRWYYDGSLDAAKVISNMRFEFLHNWYYKDGYAFPKEIKW
ncbi:hypothetical protein FALCPG4_010934 [Fusarium falciforme]